MHYVKHFLLPLLNNRGKKSTSEITCSLPRAAAGIFRDMRPGTYSRKMSYTERMFASADRICSPVVNQLFFDGTGKFDIQQWRDAVRAASSANPGSRLILKGIMGRSRWEDSAITPEVTEVNPGSWDGTGPDGAPFLMNKMDIRKGPLSEVLLIHGNPPRVCFRTHHAIMDGRGTLTWAADIFRILRGESPSGSSSALTDTGLVRSIRKDYRKKFPRNNLAPTGHAYGNERGVTWKRVTIPGRFRNILGQVAILTAREAWRYQDGPVRFSIPVDLRPHIPGLQSTGNLSIAIYIEIMHDSTPEGISAEIKKQLTEKRDCLIDRFDPLICHVPLGLIALRGRAIFRNNSRRGRYGTSGIISNMGQVPLNTFSGGGFTATAFWGIPPAFENVPYFMGIAYSDEALQLILTMPKVLANNKRIDLILENIKHGLIPA